MDAKEVQKLRGAVIQGLRDGRRIETLKSALRDSGYSRPDIEDITSSIDQSKIRRRKPRKKFNFNYIAAGIVIIAIIAGSYFLIGQPSESPTGEAISGGQNGGEHGSIPNETKIRICYASNETIKQVMIDAGIQCDEWYIIMPSP